LLTFIVMQGLTYCGRCAPGDAALQLCEDEKVVTAATRLLLCARHIGLEVDEVKWKTPRSSVAGLATAAGLALLRIEQPRELYNAYKATW